MGRKLHTLLPSTLKTRKRQKKYYNEHTRETPEFDKGEN